MSRFSVGEHGHNAELYEACRVALEADGIDCEPNDSSASSSGGLVDNRCGRVAVDSVEIETKVMTGPGIDLDAPAASPQEC